MKTLTPLVFLSIPSVRLSVCLSGCLVHVARQDPATYYGDREADIAMTQLFGSLSESFYKVGRFVCAVWLDGWQVREEEGPM